MKKAEVLGERLAMLVAVRSAFDAYPGWLKSGSNKGPISVASDCFPLSNVLMVSLSRSDCVISRIGVGEVASSNLVVPTNTFNHL
jgi:hypothetical protein